MKGMTGRQGQTVLAFLFPLILIPAFILAYFAFGAVNQEEIIQRRRLEDSLLLEIDQTNGRIEFYLDDLVEELFRSLPETSPAVSPALWAEEWKKNQPLAGTVFTLNETGDILYPELDGSDGANLFYWRYLNFFAGRETIPVYQSIAEEYGSEILSEEPLPEAEEEPDMPAMAPQSAMESFSMPIPSDSEEEYAPEAPLSESSDQIAPEALLSDNLSSADEFPSLRSKKIEGLFESDPTVQEKVYRMAEEEGQQYLERNVLPQLNADPRQEETQTVVRSVYMESTRYFQEIVSSSEYGIIPRLFDSSFILLFWARQGDLIVGCELSMERVKDRLVQAVASPANGIRYLNILDSGGEPLIPFEGKTRDLWRRPFVAKEISRWLPYWETAIILNDPEAFQKELDRTRHFLTFLITALSAMLAVVMIAVFRLSSRQMNEVQKRVGFVTNVTHELKTPLTSIRLYSEMLAQGQQDDPERVRKYAGYIARESQRLTRLIGNVLDFSKWDRGSKKLNRETIDLNCLAGELVEEIREEYEKDGFILDFRPVDVPLPVFADREAVIQVILNLLSNARKYSEARKEILIETNRADREITLSVADRGIGIPRPFRRKIFREFYRVDTSITSRYKGTGLGLAIAAHIMKNHGGRLTCTPRDRTNYRRGSRFTLSFPPAAESGDIV